MKNSIIWITLIGLGVGVGFYLRQVPEPKPDMTQYYQHQIDSIQNCNKKLDSIIQVNNSYRTVLQDSISKLETCVNKKQKDLLKLKKQYEDQINSIDKLSCTDLTNTLTNRYK